MAVVEITERIYFCQFEKYELLIEFIKHLAKNIRVACF